MMAKFGVLEQTHGLRLHAKFRLNRFILSPSGGEKTQNFTILMTSAFCGVAIGGNLRKLLNTHNLQTFPYLTVSKSFSVTPTPSWRNRAHKM